MTILSTKKLAAHLTKSLTDNNIIVDELAFIEIQFPDISETLYGIQGLENQQVIFTSKNAVKAVINGLKDVVPDWKCFVVGGKTASQVVGYFGEERLVLWTNYAEELSHAICDGAYAKDFIFFCGNRRLDLLPDKLKAYGKIVTEVVTYETHLLPQKITQHYEAILFFSPSGIESYLVSNSIDEGTVLFCIGNTTATAAREKFNGRIITALQPTDEGVVQAVSKYYKIYK